MPSNLCRVGLVLSGGGSVGAYHIGILKYLVEHSIRVDALAGASIGALNGSIIASSSSLDSATKKLEEIWSLLANNHPLEDRDSSNIYKIYKVLKELLLSPNNIGFFDDHMLRQILKDYLNVYNLNSGIPFYVSAYQSEGSLLDISKALLGKMNLNNTFPSNFFHVQSMHGAEQINAILASASIPLIFRAKKIGGNYYADGGIGGMKSAQGNTPITPLIKHERCSHIIVNHLGDGSFWNRHDFPETTILEIRPGRNITRDGLARDLLGFKPININSWIEQGYEDAYRCFSNLGSALSSIKIADAAREKRNLSIDRLNDDDFKVF